GKPIIALPSITKNGQSKIVPCISEVIHFQHISGDSAAKRAGIHRNLTNMRQRAYELIKIAHPDQRAMLEKAAFERLKVMPSAD
ncbi:unnamed protein product, partial [Gongylonema pulchrum]|uniref:AcetylCoA_hyd_C domain-containing protein n=1 Tax=Gongylonema pulchrum TaxID=637853 RepID=A0A183DJ17_9BILA